MNINKTYYQVLIPSEGYVLTTYKDGEPIESYESSIKVYCPSDVDPTIYREITIAEDEAYKAEKAAKEAE